MKGGRQYIVPQKSRQLKSVSGESRKHCLTPVLDVSVAQWRNVTLVAQNLSIALHESVETSEKIIITDIDRTKVCMLSLQNFQVEAKVLQRPEDIAEAIFEVDPSLASISMNSSAVLHQSGDFSKLKYSKAMASDLVLKFYGASLNIFEPRDLVGGRIQNEELLLWEQLVLTFTPVVAASLSSLPNMKKLESVPLFVLPPSEYEELPTEYKRESDNIEDFVLAPHYAVPLIKDNMPMKLYFNLKCMGQGVHISFGDHMKKRLDNVLKAFSRITPKAQPQNENISQEKKTIPWWDNFRYLLHGPIRVKFTDASFHLLFPIPTTRSPNCKAIPSMHSEHPQIVYHFGCIEYLSTVGESDRIAQLIQSTPSQSPFNVEIRDTVNYISKATNIDNRQGVYATVIEMLTVSVPSCPPEQWYEKQTMQDSGTTSHHLLCLAPRLSAFAALDWICAGTSAYMHHVQLLDICSTDNREIGPARTFAERDVLQMFRSNGYRAALNLSLQGSKNGLSSLPLDYSRSKSSVESIPMNMSTPTARSDQTQAFCQSELQTPAFVTPQNSKNSARMMTSINNTPYARLKPATQTKFKSKSSSYDARSLELEADVGLWGAVRMDLLGWLLSNSTNSESDAIKPSERQNTSDSGSPLDQMLSLELKVNSAPLFVASWPGTYDDSFDGFVMEMRRLKWSQRLRRQPSAYQGIGRRAKLFKDGMRMKWRALKLHMTRIREPSIFSVEIPTIVPSTSAAVATDYDLDKHPNRDGKIPPPLPPRHNKQNHILSSTTPLQNRTPQSQKTTISTTCDSVPCGNILLQALLETRYTIKAGEHATKAKGKNMVLFAEGVDFCQNDLGKEDEKVTKDECDTKKGFDRDPILVVQQDDNAESAFHYPLANPEYQNDAEVSLSTSETLEESPRNRSDSFMSTISACDGREGVLSDVPSPPIERRHRTRSSSMTSTGSTRRMSLESQVNRRRNRYKNTHGPGSLLSSSREFLGPNIFFFRDNHVDLCPAMEVLPPTHASRFRRASSRRSFEQSTPLQSMRIRGESISSSRGRARSSSATSEVVMDLSDEENDSEVSDDDRDSLGSNEDFFLDGAEDIEPQLQTDVQVSEMRIVYTIPLRDRLLLFSELYSRRCSDAEDPIL